MSQNLSITIDINTYNIGVGVNIYSLSSANPEYSHVPEIKGAQAFVINIFTTERFGTQFFHNRDSFTLWMRLMEDSVWGAWKSITFL